MDKIILILFLECVWMLLPAVSQAAGQAQAMAPVSSASMSSARTVDPSLPSRKVTPPDTTKPTPSYELYTYYGDRFRDPFIPLVGSEARTDLTSDRPPQIGSLLLKGIIQDAKGRLALLTSGVSSYILRGGRLYDGRNHLMKGISGVIKTNSVILIGSDHTVRELKVSVTL